ncbi:MAG: SDR family oxidoreductase [Pseudomonadota bacterium]
MSTVEQPRRILVIGGTGGIGAALLAAAAQRWPDAERLATHRPERPPGTGAEHWFPLDLEDPAAIDRCAAAVTAIGALDLVLIASGWLHDDQHKPEKSLRHLSADAFARAFAVNSSGPLLLLKALDQALTRSRTAVADSPARCRVLVLSAKVGSISDNSLGGWHAYRMAKAALNMGVRNLGLEYARNVRKPIIAAVHPGTTESALSAPFSTRGLPVVEAEVTARRLLDLAIELTPEHQGGFFHWDGTALPY